MKKLLPLLAVVAFVALSACSTEKQRTSDSTYTATSTTAK